jgi:hypothetical protein
LTWSVCADITLIGGVIWLIITKRGQRPRAGAKLKVNS